MCGRYASSRAPEDLAGLFAAEPELRDQAPGPSWNVAPTDPVWAVLERADRDTGEPARRLRSVRWGLVPSWAKDPSVGARMINARVETVHEKPAFRRAFARRRCLLPADGFYEWVTVPAEGSVKAHKRPYFIRPEGAGVLAMAGLYEFWRDPSVPDDGDPAAWLTTATIITTEATDRAGRVHPRMPLALDPADYAEWLDPNPADPAALRALLRTPGAGRLTVTPVSTEVNNVRNNGPHLVTPTSEDP
ncbi:SOS response-associated peptidase [Streptomyces sp. BI20]|uniref:SOS response-associated peptidase n=1 Tax=Streptomyces sp. BI20 TaxID=3403460 RepID=UPI003C793CEE